MASEFLYKKMNLLLLFCRRDDVELRPLTEPKDLEKINSAWPHRKQTSMRFIQRMAKYNLNVGAFEKDGTLVAWVLR